MRTGPSLLASAADIPAQKLFVLRTSRRTSSQPCRFSYCALLTCSILGRLQAINVPGAVQYLVACRNFDGGFGCTPGEDKAIWVWHLVVLILS